MHLKLASYRRVIASLWLLMLGCARTPVERCEWPVMGTVAAVEWKDGGTYDPTPVREILIAVEMRLNAHDPESELSRLAPLSDAEVLARCDARLRPCYAAAFRLRDETGGRFNPRWRGPGTLDLGAIAKGFAVDLAAAQIGDGRPVLLDLGGNLKVAGGEWRCGVAGDADARFTLGPGGAAATSGEYFRGAHIRDGRDGSAVTSGVYSVTVIHPTSAMLADGLSTVMFLLGPERGEAFLRTHYPEARAIWL